MVHRPGRGVLLGVGDRRGVAVRIAADLRGVVHHPDRPAADQVDHLADRVVRVVVRRGLVGVGLGQGAHDVAGRLAETGLVVRATGRVLVDAVAELVADHVDRADPLVGVVVADGYRRAVPVGVDVGQAHLDRPAAAVAVVAVAAQPVAQHVPLVLRREHHVGAAGLLAGRAAGAPGVAALGEHLAAAVVGAAEPGPGGVAQRVRAAGGRGVDGDRGGPVPLAVRGAGLDVVVAVDQLAGAGVHEDVRVARRGGRPAGQHGLPGQPGNAVPHPDDQGARLDAVHGREPGTCGLLGVRRAHQRGDARHADRPGGRRLGAADPALPVGDHDGVAADHRQAAVAALVRDRVQAAEPRGHATALVGLARALGEAVRPGGGRPVGGGDGGGERARRGSGGGRGGRRRSGGGSRQACQQGQGCPGREQSALGQSVMHRGSSNVGVLERGHRPG